jgi:clan AA aspartic protease (TIGR02281 family)
VKSIFSFFLSIRPAPILVFWMILSGHPHAGEMYKWVDDQGHVHLTDNPANIPEKYRESAEIKSIPTPNPKRQEVESQYRSIVKKPDLKEYRVPLIQQGYNYLVEVTLNGRVTARMVVDTGASLSVVSEEVAKQLGFTDTSNIPKYPFRTAGGVIWDPLVNLKTMDVGGALVEDVEASISSKIIGVDGLLGMSFLQEFDSKLDTVNGELVLAPFPDTGERTYGNRPERWWVRKYEYYVGNIRNFENMKREMEKGGESYYKTGGIDHYKNVNRILEYYRTSLDRLDQAAASSAVPLQWRKYP